MKTIHLGIGVISIPILLSPITTYAQIKTDPENSEINKPNVIFILTDDQGYGDLGCHDNPWIKTPNLDTLYKQSIRFTNYHTGTTSAPTRAGLMTGKYCNSVGVWHTVNGRSILAAEEKTVANSFKKAGYNTAIFGKWHLGDNYPYRPQDRGFNEVLIHKGGGVGQQPDYWSNDYFDDTYFRNGKAEKFQGYCTDIWFSEASKFITQNKKHPFFCYIATNAPHGPYHVEKKYSDLYKNNPNIPSPNFYGMITNIDENIGKLRELLKKLGIENNTIIVFMSDNGTSDGVKFNENGEIISGFNSNMRGIKSSPYDGGHRVPFFLHLPQKGSLKGKDISNITSYIDFAPTILDICNIEFSTNEYDGISLIPLILEKSRKWKDRILFTDTQREENLIKFKDFSVMTDKWRLVGKNELYDINNDPGQRNNIAKQHPEVVKKLLSAYNIWWNNNKRKGDKFSYIQIGGEENPTRLNTHDCHSLGGLPTWSQYGVRSGQGENGYWTIEAIRSGLYEFSLYRWPKESGLSLKSSAPEGDVVEGGSPYPAGKALDIKKAFIKLDCDNKKTKLIDKDDYCIKFTMNITKGKHKLECRFIDSFKIERDAYYVYVEHVEK